MRHSLLRVPAVGALALCLLAAVSMAAAAPALADSVYPSQHIALTPVGGAPLAMGFVENIHANGPRVFALERYVLVGAAPSTEYQVTIQIYGDPGATVSLGALPTIAFKTNGVGNGVGRFTLPFSGGGGRAPRSDALPRVGADDRGSRGLPDRSLDGGSRLTG